MNRRFVLILGAVLAASAVHAQSQEPLTTAQALMQGRLYHYQFRAGKTEVAPRAVALLEQAVARDRRNVELWNALGVAYFLRASPAALVS